MTLQWESVFGIRMLVPGRFQLPEVDGLFEQMGLDDGKEFGKPLLRKARSQFISDIGHNYKEGIMASLI